MDLDPSKILIMAAGQNPHEIEEELRRGADVNFQRLDGNTALMVACFSNKPECVTTLLNVPNINVNLENNEHETAFSIAIRFRRHHALKTLLGRHPDLVDAKIRVNGVERTPIQYLIASKSSNDTYDFLGFSNTLQVLTDFDAEARQKDLEEIERIRAIAQEALTAQYTLTLRM